MSCANQSSGTIRWKGRSPPGFPSNCKLTRFLIQNFISTPFLTLNFLSLFYCSYYRDADVFALYTLNRTGSTSLKGCANACMLDWRTDSNGTAVNTTCSTEDFCPFTSGTLVSHMKCEAFMYNVNSRKCYLIGGDTSLILRRSNSFYSGFVECHDVRSLDDWASSLTGRWSMRPELVPVWNWQEEWCHQLHVSGTSCKAFSHGGKRDRWFRQFGTW